MINGFARTVQSTGALRSIREILEPADIFEIENALPTALVDHVALTALNLLLKDFLDTFNFLKELLLFFLASIFNNHMLLVFLRYLGSHTAECPVGLVLELQ